MPSTYGGLDEPAVVLLHLHDRERRGWLLGWRPIPPPIGRSQPAGVASNATTAPVTLNDNGRQRPGWLLAWRRDRDGWRAYVEWSTGVGLNHLGWWDAGDVGAL